MSTMFNVVNVLFDTFLYNSWFLSSLSQCSDFCCDPMPGTKGSCVVAGWQCLQFHWLQALWPCSLRPHSGQSLLQSMLITLSVNSSPFWECYLQNEFKTIAEERPVHTIIVVCCWVCYLLHSANSILMIYPCSSFCCCWPSRYGHQKVGALCWISSPNGPPLYWDPCVGQKTGCVFEQGLSIGENCASRQFSSCGSNKLEFSLSLSLSHTHTHTHEVFGKKTRKGRLKGVLKHTQFLWAFLLVINLVLPSGVFYTIHAWSSYGHWKIKVTWVQAFVQDVKFVFFFFFHF
jgi:hypothetical protein